MIKKLFTKTNKPGAGQFKTMSTAEVKNRIGKPDYTLIDVRGADCFNGWRIGKHSPGGHIKGAVNFPVDWIGNKRSEIEKTLNRKGIVPEKQLILYGESEKQVTEFASWLYLQKRIPVDHISLYIPKDNQWWNHPESFSIERLPRYEKIVHSAWLHDLIHNKAAETYRGINFRIIDVSKWKTYKKHHIPGATHLDTGKIEAKPLWNVVPDKEIEGILLAEGITKDTLVILYGENPMAATRIALVLLYAGVEDVRLLNGGLAAWELAGFETQKTVPEPRPVSDFGARVPICPNYIADTDTAKQIIDDPNGRLVSIRSYNEQIGKTSGYFYIRAKGRIKGDVWGYGGSDPYHLEDYRNPDQTMRAFTEIAAMWQSAGIRPDKRIAFYCGTGWRASEAFFYAYLMGFKQISVYDGGWMEWSREKANPIESGAIE